MVEIHPVLLGRDARRLKLDTLVRLRWLAVTGQSAAVVGVHFGLGFPLPFGLCFLVIAAAAGLNLALRIRYPASHRLSDDAATLLLAFDILQLAALLYLTGGLQNPFSILFLAPVLISATALPPERTLGLGLLAIGGATLLVLAHRSLPWGGSGPHPQLPFLYVSGIWTAILLGIAFTGVYAWRVAEEGRQLAQALAATELVLAREQHLSQLDGLAAAAAHELGTPLATIALVAKELDLQVPKDSALADDVKLLREQVARCRGILAKLTSLDEEETGFLKTMTLSHLLEEVAAPQRSFGIDIEVRCQGDGPEPACRRSPGLLYGLANLVDNAVDFAANQGLHRGALDGGGGSDHNPRRRAWLRAGRAVARRRALRDDTRTGPGSGRERVGARTRLVHRQDPDRAVRRATAPQQRRSTRQRSRGADRMAASRLRAGRGARRRRAVQCRSAPDGRTSPSYIRG